MADQHAQPDVCYPPRGHGVVHKRLDDDCLLDGQLHPSIRLRLERVRELPTRAVANLHGVERAGGVVRLVWDFVPGRTLEEVAREWTTAEQAGAMRREVLLAVESLHSAGIVHRAIHARNVIVDDRGQVTLTHVSPLLYTDPADDLAAVEAMFEALPAAPADGADQAHAGAAATKSTAGAAATMTMTTTNERLGLRRRDIMKAAAALVVGVGFAAFVLWFVAPPS